MANHKPLILTSPKQRQGSLFEQQACEYLQTQGLRLVAQNWQQPKIGELDLIMMEAGPAWSTLVFIEVRQRKRSVYGDAALSVTTSKQRKVIKAAQCFCSSILSTLIMTAALMSLLIIRRVSSAQKRIR